MSQVAKVTTEVSQEWAGWSARRVNLLGEALGATSYLEVGVATGSTFSAVTIPKRTGVDPRFRFDIEAAADHLTILKQMPSDQFFAELRIGETFDVIFLDGLHTFEQTYRDLCNSLAHSHRRTVILIDDTQPSDVYSAVPDFESAIRFRRAAGGDSDAWHGDTFKVVFAIHDFHPALNYRTIVGSGNAQTLVWPSRECRRTPRFDSFKAIARLTYFDLLEEEDILRCTSEDDAISACLAELIR